MLKGPRRRKTRVLSPQQGAIVRLYIDEEHPEYGTRALYGSEIMRLLELPAGTVYPALRTLEDRGILASQREGRSGRPGPRRVFYTLEDGSGGAAALAELSAHDQAARARLRSGVRRHMPLASAGSES